MVEIVSLKQAVLGGSLFNRGDSANTNHRKRHAGILPLLRGGAPKI